MVGPRPCEPVKKTRPENGAAIANGGGNRCHLQRCGQNPPLTDRHVRSVSRRPCFSWAHFLQIVFTGNQTGSLPRQGNSRWFPQAQKGRDLPDFFRTSGNAILKEEGATGIFHPVPQSLFAMTISSDSDPTLHHPVVDFDRSRAGVMKVRPSRSQPRQRSHRQKICSRRVSPERAISACCQALVVFPILSRLSGIIGWHRSHR